MSDEVHICLFIVLPFVFFNGLTSAWQALGIGAWCRSRDIMFVVGMVSAIISVVLWLANAVIVLTE